MYDGFHTSEDVMREFLIQGSNLDVYGVPELYPINVSPASKCSVFSAEVAKDLLEQATEAYTKKFDETVDFNFIKIDIGNKTGKYWRDKNKLLIYQDGVPVYENNNGVICRDSVALADGLM